MFIEESAITAPKGFLAAGVSCGLKKSAALDLALVYSQTPAAVAGVYTQNLVKGHSLQRTIKLINNQSKVQAILVNSGNANACVGKEGLEDAESIANAIAQELGCSNEAVLTCSTGVIGQRLPTAKILAGIAKLTQSANASPEAGHKAMSAMMTTDLVPKEVAIQLEIQGKTVTIAGMAKGSGMIHPNLATMIGIITTDAGISNSVLQQLLKRAVAHSFNRVTVDGDTSVCDSVILLANGESGVSINLDSPECDSFYQGLEAICQSLAKKLAADGEGATKLVEVEVKHAPSAQDAYLILLAICRSPLCKTAIFGEDANWGRFITAAGYSGAQFNPEKISIAIGDLLLCEQGVALPFDEIKAKEILSQKEIYICLDLHQGEYWDRMWTCDYSYDYIKINGSYRS